MKLPHHPNPSTTPAQTEESSTGNLKKYLQEAERAKKRMYLEACLQQRRHFSPFVDSVDGLLGVEATATLKRIPIRLATKSKKPYS